MQHEIYQKNYITIISICSLLLSLDLLYMTKEYSYVQIPNNMVVRIDLKLVA